MSTETKIVVPDYRSFRTGMAVNGGQRADKLRLIDLLTELELLAADLGLYVNGGALARQIPGIIGGLQRSVDSIDEGGEIREGYNQP